MKIREEQLLGPTSGSVVGQFKFHCASLVARETLK